MTEPSEQITLAAPPSPPTTVGPALGRRSLLHRWPSALGLGLAALLLSTGVADTLTGGLAASAAALCYLAAAALGRPWVAWAAILGSFLVLVASDLVALPWWAGLGVAGAALLLVGVLRGAPRPQLAAQSAALVAFGAVGMGALALGASAALVVAGLGLVAHAVWDAVHFVRNQVVPRSMVELCMLLDAPLGLGLVAIALTS